ncbi:MAG: hypothetical protein WBC44_14535 [Planctomycetaceae bacterium]
MATAGGTCLRTAALLSHFSIAAAILSLASPATAADPTPQELAARLRETLTGLHTIEMEYRESTSNQFGDKPSNTFINEYEWIRDGQRQLLVRKEGDFAAGQWSFDGNYGFSVGYRKGQPDTAREITKSRSVPWQLNNQYTPAFWMGLRLSELNENLAELLLDPQARVTGSELRGDLKLYRVDLGTHGDEASDPWSWSVSLCPDRDGLPVEIIRTPAANHPDRKRLEELIGETSFVVTEFRAIRDHALQRDRWVPWNMRLEMAKSTWTLDMVLARVNHDVSPERFVPQPGAGTFAIDETTPGRRSVRVNLPQEARSQRAQDLIEEVRAPSATPRPAVAAPPDSGRWSRRAAWGGAILLFVAAVTYFRRSWRAV